MRFSRGLRCIRAFYLLIILIMVCIGLGLLSTLSKTETAETYGGYRMPDNIGQRSYKYPNINGGSPTLVIHLDLKGSPPNIKFFMEFLDLISKAGANGLLLEYEDMFPFEGKLSNLSARNAYTKEQLLSILQKASSLKLEVIPLVQTFGHLQYMLKLADFRHLREMDVFPQEVCPSHPETQPVLQEMLRQVITLHKAANQPVRFLHIGCDEVYNINKCERCRRRKLSKHALFLQHAKKVAKFVKDSFPGVTPIMWDDMLRGMGLKELQQSGLGDLVEPVIWEYSTDVQAQVRYGVWNMYKRVFRRLWGTAAYRGASGPAALVPRLDERLQNVISWRFMKPDVLVLAGWARYDHFAVLCDLLPLSVPSLMLTMAEATDHNRPPTTDADMGQLMERWHRFLNCPLHVKILNVHVHPSTLSRCDFLGADAFAAVAECDYLLSEMEYNLRNTDGYRGWMNLYNVRQNFSNSAILLRIIGGKLAVEAGISVTNPSIPQARDAIRYCRRAQEYVLKKYMDMHSVREWLAQKYEPFEKLLDQWEAQILAMLKFQTWPRRPFN